MVKHSTYLIDSHVHVGQDFVQGKLDCMNKCDVFDCKGTDECDNCQYCYSQGNFGEQKKAFETAIKAFEEIEQYRAIGTVEEFKALKEKNTPMELAEHNFQDEVHHYLCPMCRSIVNYCQNYCEECGQRLGE